jgi:class 3 adenylate cyclase
MTNPDQKSIGDTLNAASRLEGANKEYGDTTTEVTILASAAVVLAAGFEDIAKEVGSVQLRGRKQETKIFAI